MSEPAPRTDLRVVRPGEQPDYPKASLWLRAGARAVDLAIAWGLFHATGPAGFVMALLYLLLADGMLQGQSPGKKIFGVKVVYLPNRQSARHRDSVLRNAPLGLVIILSRMPEMGLKAFIAGAVVIGAIETVRSVRDPLGQRLGDLWAQTQVIDGKVPTELPQRTAEAEPARANARYKSQVHLPRHRSPPHEGTPCASR